MVLYGGDGAVAARLVAPHAGNPARCGAAGRRRIGRVTIVSIAEAADGMRIVFVAAEITDISRFVVQVIASRSVCCYSCRRPEESTITKLGVFYEGYNIGYFSNYSYSRVSYLMNNVSGAGSASQLIYIPTDTELETMPFSSEENKAEYAAFLASDKYTSKHRGEYAKRNGALAPWLNRINVRIAQDINFNVAGKKQTLEIGLDANNVGNMINSDWGIFKQLNSNNIISYKDGVYTFTAPVWGNYAEGVSAWSLLLSAKYYF